MNKRLPNTGKNFAKQIADLLTVQLLGPLIPIILKEAAEEYLAYVKLNKAYKTYIGVRTFINHLFKYFSQLRKLETIKQKDIQVFLSSLRKNAPLAVENYYRIGRTFFNWLIKQNYLRQNPFIGIELPKRQIKKPAFFCLQEAQLIWNKLEEMGKVIIKNIMIVAFFTGMRFGELTNLKWRSINLKERLIIVGETFVTKTKRTRVIPMNDVVYNLLNDLKSKLSNNKKIDDEYVFSKKNKKKLTVDWVSKSFKKAVRELGMDDSIHLYSTRHSAASHLVSKGSNIFAIKEILGHQSILTTQIYTHLNIDDLRKAIE